MIKIKTILFLISILIGAFVLGLLGAMLEQNISRMPLVAYTFGYSVLIVVVLIYYRDYIKKHAALIEAITAILFAFFMVMTFFTAYQTYKIGVEENKPKLSVQIKTNEMPWYRGSILHSEYVIDEEEEKQYSLNIPVYVWITNWGSVNTQIEAIYWNSTCTDDAHYFFIPSTQKSLIEPGEFFSLNKTINIDYSNNKTIGDLIPCDIQFKIYGPNFEEINGVLTVKK